MPTSASGCIRYYADVAPAAAKILRFLLMLPGGNRTEGLAQMLRARTRGRLLQGEADYQLQVIYLWYEHRTDLAVELLQSLHERYPGNPLFLSQIARGPGYVSARHHGQPRHVADAARSAREQRVNESDDGRGPRPAGHRPTTRRAVSDRSRHRAAAPGR